MSNINCTHNITFRSKFEKFIKCDVEHEVFLEAFEKFLSLDEDTAINMLWRLTITSDTAILEKIGLYDGISTEILDTLRRELRYQYETRHGKICVDIGDEVNQAYNILKSHTDTVVATVVYQHCRSILYLEAYEIRRILYLLSHSSEQYYYGGLKALLFESWEAEYLKPYHELVHNLLQSMFEAYNEQMAATQNRPFANLANIVNFDELEDTSDLPFHFGESDSKNQETDKHPIDIAETDEVHLCPEPELLTETQPEESLAVKQCFKPISPVNVLTDKDTFSAFVIHHDFACLGQLNKLGYDLNEIVAKENAIRDFLTAVEAL